MKILKIIMGIILIGAIISLAFLMLKNKIPLVPSTEERPNVRTQDAGITISGKISKMDRSCEHDGICSITVNDKKIIYGVGWNDIRGKVIGNLDIGDEVEALVTKIENNYTIDGEGYYIKVKEECIGEGGIADEYSFGKYIGPTKCCAGLVKVSNKSNIPDDTMTICAKPK